MSKDIFVVVAGGDPLGFTQCGSLDDSKAMKAKIEPKYGECRIAKLVFIDEPVFSQGVLENGAVILRDGEPMSTDEILDWLRDGWAG